MKPCDTPMCEGTTVRAKWCRRCYDRHREQTTARKTWVTKYMQRPHVKQMRKENNQAYRDAGKVIRGECEHCGGPTTDQRARRCLACYRARVLPLARKRGLKAIHGRSV